MKSRHVLKKLMRLDSAMPKTLQTSSDKFLCPDGKAQIDVCLYDGISLFNPLSAGKQRELSSEIYDYIDAQLYTIPSLQPVRIRFCGAIPNGASSDDIRALIRDHYSFLYRDCKEDLRINLIKIIALAALGILCWAVSLTLQGLSPDSLFTEILGIIGSFSMWEAVDFWLLERKGLKIKHLDAAQSALCEVTFHDGKSE